MEKLKGKAWKVGNDIDTDVIIPARYLNTSDGDFLAAHCLEDLIPNVKEKITPGDILVAGKNFGCGSSREHAPIAIKYAGFSCVLAESYARIFYRNAINIGLPIIVAPEACREAIEGDVLEVDPTTGVIHNLAQSRSYQGEPFPPFMLEILESGGVIPFTAKKLKGKA
ncbi:MAG: 3-isopropylmalate dehydratase small subunit [Clostridia bacterium]|jgi:3-isopropylmalate dehydratase small subunit|nr:3-isopropylmalate dehydratase small subunit [Clostridia bacterium]